MVDVRVNKATPARLSAFSDGVFAVLITVLVLDLRPPDLPSFQALVDLWPRWLSYAVSYLFIAILWVNHHHVLRYRAHASLNLAWYNFAHLFSASLIPLATSWLAQTRLAPQPVAFYAAVFFFANVTYIALCWELIYQFPDDVPSSVRRSMLVRSITTLCLFGAAALVALRFPLWGLAICCCCLGFYVKPSPPGVRAID